MGFFEEIKDLSEKSKLAKKFKLDSIPSNAEIFLKSGVGKSKPVRTFSGVAPVALMTAPFPCPHGRCLYCPGGVKSAFGDVPQSYTGFEPSTLRGIRNDFDSYLIVFNRLEQFFVLGHVPEKVELIIQGGTFPALPSQYQEDFVTYALKAMNDFGDMFYSNGLDREKLCEFFELPGDFSSVSRLDRVKKKILSLKGSSSLLVEQLRNETAKIRCVAMCIETRPDWCFEKHVDEMLRLGATRVELGVQCLDDDVLNFVHRGHGVAEVVKATRIMKDSLLKVGYHMMPDLPGMSKEKDIDGFRRLFSDSKFFPDALKIYPTAVLKGTGLYGLWKEGKYKPLSVDDAVDIVVSLKQFVPKWCRIMRIQRDIPDKHIEAGSSLTNLRQSVEKKLKEKGLSCHCIRCREPRDKKVNWSNLKLLCEDLGDEVFLSFEADDLLLGFCRLRFCSSHRPEFVGKCAGIRELHVYGTALGLGESGDIQHKGLGKKLVLEAERIAKSRGCTKMLIISGIGVREYYYNLGYVKDGVYVSKKL